MDELPDPPPPVSYFERERNSARGCAVRLGSIALVTVVLGLAAALFVTVGANVAGTTGKRWGLAAWLVASLAGAVYFVRWRALRRLPAAAPWERDRNWPRGGEVRSAAGRGLGRGGLTWVAVLLVGGLLILWRKGVLSPGFIAAAALSVGVVILAARAWLQGAVELRWDEFPMRTGTRVRFHVATTAGGASMPEFSVVLRCIETREIPGDIDVSTHVAAIIPCVTRGPLATGPEQFVTVEFDIPADAPGTDLSCRGDERHWELVVLGTTAWGKIAETFVVPIYAVEAADAGAGSA